MAAKPTYEELEQKINQLKKEKDASLFLDLAGVIFIELDIEGIVKLANKKACEVFAYTESEMLGKNWFENFLPERIKKEILPISKKILLGEITTSEYYENPILTKSGEERIIYWHNSAIKDENGKIIGHLSSGNDITQRKIIEQELLKKNTELQTSEEELRAFNEELVTTSEALKKSNELLMNAKEKAEEGNRLKTEFLNNMSHEIRTPLNGIIGFVEFISKPNLSDEKRNQFAKIIRTSSQQLLKIINDILEISSLETKQVKVIETKICLNDLLLDLFSTFDVKAKENRTPLYLRKGLSDRDSTIFADEEKLHKILSKLLENAIKFTNEGFIDLGYIINKKDEEQNSILIYVKDTGIGIDKDNEKLIFERFTQEEKTLSRTVGGLGLGLPIAKENAELFGGAITFESEKGKGSTFFITIPYKPVYPNTLEGTLKGSIVESNSAKSTILITEDEEVNYLYLEILLLEELKIDCNIIHAKNGKEAIEICEKNPNIDLVLMDLKMPKVNGFQATAKIKELRSDLPIIAQTAYSTENDKAKAILAGCDDFISKPTSEEVLESIIHKYLLKK